VATVFEKLAIAREWDRQGRPGSRPVIKALPHHRVRLIREVVEELKLRKRRKSEKKRKEVRVSVKVLHSGVMMAMDAGQVPSEGGDFIISRDRGSISVNAEKCESTSARSSDTLRVLNTLKEENKLPLVWCTDNGSPFCSEIVEDFLSENLVVHLKSLPRVPQHNGSGESAVNDFKSGIKQGRSPEQTCLVFNQHRLRAKLNWQTPAQAEQTNRKLCTPDERTMFYETARAAVNVAVLGTKNAKEKRKAEREAILQTLETFSFITITRGHRSRWTKAEEIT